MPLKQSRMIKGVMHNRIRLMISLASLTFKSRAPRGMMTRIRLIIHQRNRDRQAETDFFSCTSVSQSLGA